MQKMRLCSVVWLWLAAGCSPVTLDGFLYSPLKTDAYQFESGVIPSWRQLTTTTSDGVELYMVFVPGAATSGVTLLYCHGQSTDLSTAWPRLEYLYPLGYNLMTFDYRGFGRSGGSPTEPGIVLDELAVHEALIQQSGVDPAKLIYYGRSFGGAPCIDLATHHAPAVLIEESTFTSVDALVHDATYFDLPRNFVATSKWDSLSKIATLGAVPFLALHGKSDDYVQPKYSIELTAAHPGTTELILVNDADHSDVPEKVGLDTYRATVGAFVRAAIP
jgi:pimeloyl-ACP methyl ester carboxylesterase